MTLYAYDYILTLSGLEIYDIIFLYSLYLHYRCLRNLPQRLLFMVNKITVNSKIIKVVVTIKLLVANICLHIFMGIKVADELDNL